MKSHQRSSSRALLEWTISQAEAKPWFRKSCRIFWEITNQLVLDLGNDIDAVDQNGETAMHGAAYKNLPEVVALLAASGADIDIWNQQNAMGWTPLSIARGYRVGNFKPSPVTVVAIERAMEVLGVTPLTEEEEAARGFDVYAPRSPEKAPAATQSPVTPPN